MRVLANNCCAITKVVNFTNRPALLEMHSLTTLFFKDLRKKCESLITCLFTYILNKIINAPCGTLKLLLALGVAKYIKSYKIHFVVQYATDYCPLEHDNYKTISAHLGSPISCYINNLHGAFIFLLSVCINKVNFCPKNCF